MRPATDRPGCTALLDQLRAGTDPVAAPAPTLVAALPRAAARPGTGGGPRSPPPTSPAAAPAAPPEPAARVALPTRDRREDPRLAADRRALRDLGLPAAWTRGLRPGDRFTAVLRMLERMPEVDFDPATRVVAVVGPAASATLEAHRTALDLPVVDGTLVPRSVVRLPAASGAERASALAEARFPATSSSPSRRTAPRRCRPPSRHCRPWARAPSSPSSPPAAVSSTRRTGSTPSARSTRSSSRARSPAPSPPRSLQLGLPVVRLDGVAVDRHTWTALLCAQPRPDGRRVSPLRAGLVLAAVVAGPPLWSLAAGGALDTDAALARWGLVAAGCAVGAEAVSRLAGGYASQVRRNRALQAVVEAHAAAEKYTAD